MLTAEEIIRDIPMFRRKDKLHPRPEFKDIHRMLLSYKYGEKELGMLRAQVDALLAEREYQATKYKDEE